MKTSYLVIMKTFISIFILIFLFISGHLFAQDSIKYAKVIEFVKNSDYLEKAFKQYHDTLNLCISVQRIYPSYLYFAYEIINYEYPNLSYKVKDSLESSFRDKELNDSISNPMQFDVLPDSVHKGKNCNLMMYLSNVDSNKIYVEVTLWNEKELTSNIIEWPRSPVGLHYLFYFDDTNILKVFKAITYK